MTTMAAQPEAAQAFIDFLQSETAQAVLEEHGFRRTQ
jgi:ABC-type molybdate transport system substrate-binding protein